MENVLNILEEHYAIIFIIPLLIIIQLVNWRAKILRQRAGGNTFTWVFGIIGVPTHELGHALFCVIFRHEITRLVLFSPSGKEGFLGVVEHQFDKGNIYQRIGRFFIPLGPMILGTSILVLLTNLFDLRNISLEVVFGSIQSFLLHLFLFYIFMCISSYMIMSPQDMNNLFTGGAIVFLAFSAIIFVFFPIVFTWIFNTLLLVLAIVLANLALSILIYLIAKYLRK